ncbi:hypothetical protein BMS84_08025 [Leuconostoc pseudomesenteroides]|nr:hypothetical protein BMS84_08025 [Leuconostoc pseudomesenteroides]
MSKVLIVEDEENLAKFVGLELKHEGYEVAGQVSYLDNDDIILTMTVTGTITVPSSRSLEAVKLPVEVTIDERYTYKNEKMSDNGVKLN